MNTAIGRALGAALITILTAGSLNAQTLHTNDRWKECAFLIDPSLTQEAWHQFVAEVGPVMYFRPLVSAEALGAGHVELGALRWVTGIDDADAAWNDTFSHPDADHYLFEGDGLPIPGLMLRVGMTDRLDVGAYLTKNPASNYGIAGAQAQYSLVGGDARKVAAAGRATFATLYGPDDLSAAVYGLDFLVSTDLWVLSPYAGVSGYLSRGQEHTTKVELDSESVFGAQGTVGVATKISVLRLGAEVNVARVPNYSLKIGIGS